MKPYYEDDFVTLYHGDCLEVLPTLEKMEAAHLVTDPPYFKVKPDAWDNQWGGASDFLNWMGQWLAVAKGLLPANASVWVFASPQMATAVETAIGKQFRVLNSCRWMKEAGWHQKADLSQARSLLSPWEAVIFAEQFADEYRDMAKALHREVFAPIGRYMQTEWERAGWKSGKLGVALGYDSALPTRWAEGSSLPSKEAYERARSLLNRDGNEYLRREYEDLRREYEDLRREYEDLRRPFTVTKRSLATDTFHFPPVMGYQEKHPCEKPLALMEHIITISTRPGDTVIDPFAGSGTTLAAAKYTGRRAIGVELDERYCEIAARRLSQDVLDIEGLTA